MKMVSFPHHQLKEKGKSMLLGMGFDGSKIKFEHWIDIKGNSYRVDIYAEHEGKKVIIECGSMAEKRKKLLDKFADKLIHLEYDKNSPVGIELNPELNLQLKVFCAERGLFVKEFISTLIEYFFYLHDERNRKKLQ